MTPLPGLHMPRDNFSPQFVQFGKNLTQIYDFKYHYQTLREGIV